MTTETMDLTDRKLLNVVQSNFPVAEEPYRAIADDLGITEDDVLARLAELKRQNVVRQISAIFDTRRLGYKTTLVAFAYGEGDLHDGAIYINRHPGVSHNYAREGSYYNLWFTLAVPPDGDLAETVQWMAQQTGAIEYRIMPTIRFFKIGVNFDMVKRRSDAYNYNPDSGRADAGRPNGANNGQSRVPASDWNQAQEITEWDKDVIREAQEDLPLISRPFDPMAERLGLHHAGTVRAVGRVPGAQADAPVQRSPVPSPFRVPRQRHDCLESSAGTLRRSRHDYGRERGGHPLLRTSHLPRLGVQPLHHGPRPHPGRVRGNRPGHRPGHRHHRQPAAVQHAGIQEDQGSVLR